MKKSFVVFSCVTAQILSAGNVFAQIACGPDSAKYVYLADINNLLEEYKTINEQYEGIVIAGDTSKNVGSLDKDSDLIKGLLITGGVGSTVAAATTAVAIGFNFSTSSQLNKATGAQGGTLSNIATLTKNLTEKNISFDAITKLEGSAYVGDEKRNEVFGLINCLDGKIKEMKGEDSRRVYTYKGLEKTPVDINSWGVVGFINHDDGDQYQLKCGGMGITAGQLIKDLTGNGIPQSCHLYRVEGAEATAGAVTTAERKIPSNIKLTDISLTNEGHAGIKSSLEKIIEDWNGADGNSNNTIVCGPSAVAVTAAQTGAAAGGGE